MYGIKALATRRAVSGLGNGITGVHARRTEPGIQACAQSWIPGSRRRAPRNDDVTGMTM